MIEILDTIFNTFYQQNNRNLKKIINNKIIKVAQTFFKSFYTIGFLSDFWK